MAAGKWYILLALPFLLLSLSASHYSEYYARGVQSYFDDNDWKTAAETLQKSLEDYDLMNKARLTCYTKCDKEPVSIPPDYIQDDRLHFYHTIIQAATCRRNCMKQLVGDRSLSYSSKIEEAISSGEIYNYLQYSFYQTGQVTKAASYAATHLYFSPDSSTARANMEFYEGLEELSKNEFKPVKSQLYRDLYTKGQELYEKNEYKEMVGLFEESLTNYYTEVEKCRFACEGPQKLTDSDDFGSAMWSVHYTYLKCIYGCTEKLGDFRDENQRVNFLGSFFHYLTYGYFHLGNMTAAAKAVMTHLRIEPSSKIALMNRGYIKQQPGVTIKDFVEREDPLLLLERMEKERKMLKSIEGFLADYSKNNGFIKLVHESDKNDEELLDGDYQKFPIVGDEETELTDEGDKTTKQEDTNGKEEEQEVKTQGENNSQDKRSTNESDTYTVLETAKDHGGIERILIDNLLSQEQCSILLELTKHCKEGDGYQKKTPHTIHEKFEGLTVMDAAKGVVMKQIDKKQVQLYLDASRDVRSLLVQQFNLTKTLYFSFTHLVCRTANPNSPTKRDDLSHPVHADNCFQETHNGECIKRSPAYTWRDYSAIVYLNDDFEGGNFFFAHSPFDSRPQHYVSPKCGRMVGFSAGKENMHGVAPITSGKRCAIALWLTLDPNYKETTFDEAQILLNGTD